MIPHVPRSAMSLGADLVKAVSSHRTHVARSGATEGSSWTKKGKSVANTGFWESAASDRPTWGRGGVRILPDRNKGVVLWLRWFAS